MKKITQYNDQIDVILPVYNAQKYLRAALNGMLAQTHENWRLFAYDDCSTDNSWEIMKEYAKKDKRIQVFQNKKNIGSAFTNAKAMKHCTNQYVAKIDADDICMPEKFAKQLTFLKENPDVVAVGGQCLVIDGKGKVRGEKRFPVDSGKVSNLIFTSMPIQHPTVMFNTSLVPKSFSWYKGRVNVVEDVGLFFHLLKFGKIANLPDYVLKYRIHGENASLKKPREIFLLTLKQRMIAIKEYGYRPSIMGVITNMAQLAAVCMLPNEVARNLYYWTKGLKLS